MKNRKKLISLCLCLFLLAPSIVTEAKTLVTDKEGNYIPIPVAYEVWGSIKNMGTAGFMNHPSEFDIDKNGYLYVADTENNRIVKMTKNGEVLAIFDQAGDKSLQKPGGVFVREDGTIWIADTGNLRIVVLTAEGETKEIYTKPKSSLFDDSFTFDPQKIAVGTTGYIYALKGANLMNIDGQNNFRGYIGANHVSFSLKRFFIRMFGTKSQIERTLKQEPEAYNNFDIGPDGMIYGILANAKTGQIRKLNSVGNNTYPQEKYGFSITDKAKNEVIEPFFSDIAVSENGILSLVDRNSGLIYQYDQDGNLLAAFGGLGDYQGTFQIPVSIAVDQEGFLYVLDYSTGGITIFEPTNFIKLIHQAVTLYGEGKYSESKEYWEQVLEIDANYSLAHLGIARVLTKEGKFIEAMNEFKMADNTEGFSKAFSEYRHEIFRVHFGVVVFLIAGILFLVTKGYVVAKKHAKKWNHKIQMGGNI